VVSRYTGGLLGAPSAASRAMAAEADEQDGESSSRVGGLGDEAFRCQLGCGTAEVVYRVRVSNLVVRVTLDGEDGDPVPDALRRQVLAVTRAALARLPGPRPSGAATPGPSPPITGTDPVDVCTLIGPALIAQAVPGASPPDGGATSTDKPGTCGRSNGDDAPPYVQLRVSVLRYGSVTAAREHLGCDDWRKAPDGTPAAEYHFQSPAGVGDASCDTVTDQGDYLDIQLSAQHGGDCVVLGLGYGPYRGRVTVGTELDLAGRIVGHVFDQLR
jgi:hypothetical protein